MDEAAALDEIASEIELILSRFRQAGNALWIAEGDQAKFHGLVLKARALMKRRLGLANDFQFEIERVRSDGLANFYETQTRNSVETAAGIVRAAAEMIRSEIELGPANRLGGYKARATEQYVSLSRLSELRSIAHGQWDLRRLVRLCEELNSASENGNLLSVAMILRAIKDHVPPIFAAKHFSEFANQIAGQSVKKSMLHLETSLKNIADTWLHQQIRSSEVLPSETQVNFRQDLDVLLGEVVRALRSP